MAAQGSRNWDDEVGEALRAAQNAAGFEHVGLLSGLSLMAVLGAKANRLTDEPPDFVRDAGTGRTHSRSAPTWCSATSWSCSTAPGRRRSNWSASRKS
jgi:hypothetical protein